MSEKEGERVCVCERESERERENNMCLLVGKARDEKRRKLQNARAKLLGGHS